MLRMGAVALLAAGVVAFASPAAWAESGACPAGGTGTADCPFIDNTGTDGFGNDGFGGGFAAFFMLAILVGVGTTVYKINAAKDMARRAGLDPHDAAVTTFLSDEGLAATYVASSLQPRVANTARPEAHPTVESRLAELKRLKDKGLVTDSEYDERRSAILAEL
jgi:hypothetical protein